MGNQADRTVADGGDRRRNRWNNHSHVYANIPIGGKCRLNQLIESAALLPEMASIDARQLFEARAEASRRGVPVIRFLEEVHGWAPDGLTAELGRLLRMPVLTMENLHALAPAFEKLPFSEAVTQECALFRSGEKYVLAVGNPFLPHLRAWADDHINIPAAWHLVHPANLAAFFSQQEQTMRAMDSVLPAAHRDATQAGEENLSLKTINEGTSPV